MSSRLQEAKILVTREESQAKAFSNIILEKGGIPFEVPLLTINCKYSSANDYIIESLAKYEWIFFTSSNGVECFFEIINRSKQSYDLSLCKFAAVGTKTEMALTKHGYRADFIPTIFNADTMANEFSINHINCGPILLVRGNRSRDVLPDQLSEKGYYFDLFEVYETVHNQKVKHELNNLLNNEKIDFLTFTSPSTIDAFIGMVDKMTDFNTYTCVCIGTTTEKRAREVGFNTIIVPETFTIEGMVEQMIYYLKRKESYDGK